MSGNSDKNLDFLFSSIVRNRGLSFMEGQAKSVTFVVTEDCQLRCSYCYVHGKNDVNVMSFDVARDAIEYLIGNRDLFNDPGLIVEYIGGEPLMEIDLIDKISDYLKLRLYETDHPWFDSYRFSISTNGLLYDDPRVQSFIEKNRTHISIGITIDGTRQKHDMCRVYADGRGSYDDVVKNIPLWLSQFPNAGTKVTVASDDIPYITESVLHLYDLGIKEVNINAVFEDLWKDGDPERFEAELIKLADAIVDGRLFRDHFCSFFMDFIGHSLPREDDKNWCGSGMAMIAVDTKGNLYPCNRFLPFTMANRRARVIGTVKDGIDLNLLRPFYALNRSCQSNDECMGCDVASGCAWCVGYNYDVADTETIYQRAVSICELHKARVRAMEYYRKRLNELSDDEIAAASCVRCEG